MNERPSNYTRRIIASDDEAVKVAASEKIKVTVHIPEKVSDVSRQQRINRIYDILNPKA